MIEFVPETREIAESALAVFALHPAARAALKVETMVWALRTFFVPGAALVMFATVGIATATIAAMTASNSIRLKPHLIDLIYGFFKMGSEEKVRQLRKIRRPSISHRASGTFLRSM